MNRVECAAVEKHVMGDAIASVEQEYPEFLLVKVGKGRKDALHEMFGGNGRSGDDDLLAHGAHAPVGFLVEGTPICFIRMPAEVKGKLIPLWSAGHGLILARSRVGLGQRPVPPKPNTRVERTIENGHT